MDQDIVVSGNLLPISLRNRYDPMYVCSGIGQAVRASDFPNKDHKLAYWVIIKTLAFIQSSDCESSLIDHSSAERAPTISVKLLLALTIPFEPWTRQQRWRSTIAFVQCGHCYWDRRSG